MDYRVAASSVDRDALEPKDDDVRHAEHSAVTHR